ncbi:trypsin-like serine protease [Methylobacterium sp. E-005]|uniref:trypsin-like serine peptidase n=1 Tax=Methylobacterium sp. E-005 TaxID=2836549 RepID=UPI001FB8B969|nr:trypsin-like serine protease [Methylobacterium sp. E-005]MCJ2088597.1 trypsin-like serine protease [Methylobacterium sp. E-005]
MRLVYGSSTCVALSLVAMAAAQAQSMVPPLPQAPTPDLDPRTWPLSAVGKLNVVTGPGSRKYCTATLVGPRHALTAAHCLWDGARQRWVDAANIHFVAGYEQGRYTAHSIAKAYTKPDAYRFGTSREDLSRDWAVVELAEPIPLKPLGLSAALGPATRATTLTGIVHAGYKSYANQIISVERGCQARYEPSALPLLDHFCRVVPGESGSALILRDGEPGIVGILVAGSSNGTSIAVPVSSFRAAVEAALTRTAGSVAAKPARVPTP